MHNRQQLITIIEAKCITKSGLINIADVLGHFIENQAIYEECVTNSEWIQAYFSTDKSIDLSNNSAQLIKTISLSCWDITVTKLILESLSVNSQNKTKNLRSAILDFDNIKLGSAEQNLAIIRFLKDAGILSAIQFICSISLLTGGYREDTQLDIHTLAELLRNAELSWEDILGVSSMNSPYEMAIESDDPYILLNVLGERNVFRIDDLSQIIQPNKNLLSYLIQNKKYKILKKIFLDLQIDDIAKIKDIYKKLNEIRNVEVKDIVLEKLVLIDAKKNDIFHAKTTHLLNYIVRSINKIMLTIQLDQKTKDFAKNLLEEIQNEIKRPVFLMFGVLYNNYNIFLEMTKNLQKNQNDSCQNEKNTKPAHLDVTKKSIIDEVSRQHIYPKKSKLEHATHEFLHEMKLDDEIAEKLSNSLSKWLEVAIDYARSSEYEMKAKYSSSPLHNKLLVSMENVSHFLEKIQISEAAFSLNLKAIPDFLEDLIVPDSHHLGFTAIFAFQQFLKIQHTLLGAFIELLKSEAKETIVALESNEAQNQKSFDKIVHRWGISGEILQSSKELDAKAKAKALSVTIIAKLEDLCLRVHMVSGNFHSSSSSQP